MVAVTEMEAAVAVRTKKGGAAAVERTSETLSAAAERVTEPVHGQHEKPLPAIAQKRQFVQIVVPPS